MSEEQLKLREEKKLYPPKFVITVTGSSTSKDSQAVFTFEGATRNIVKNISLTKGIVHLTCQVKYLASLWGKIEQVAWKPCVV